MSDLKAGTLKWVLSTIGLQAIVVVGAIVTRARSVHWTASWHAIVDRGGLS